MIKQDALKNVLLIIILLVINVQIACNQKIEKKYKKNGLVAWLKIPTNLNQKNYRDTFNSAYQKAISTKQIDVAADLVNAYGNALDVRFEYDSTFVMYSKNFLQQNLQHLDDYNKISVNYYIGSQYDFVGNIDSSTHYLGKTKIKTENKEAIKLQSFAGIILGNQLIAQEKTEAAMQQYQENLKLSESIDDSVNMATAMLSIANVYLHMKMYEENKKYLLQSIPISISQKDTINLWTAYTNLSRPGELLVNKDTSLYYAIKMKTVFDAWTLKTDFYKSNTYYNYGKAMYLNDKLDSALYYYKIAEAYCKNLSLKQDLIVSNSIIAKQLGKPQNIKEIKEMYAICKQNNNVYAIGALLSILADDAIATKNYKEALEYNTQKFAIRDSAWMQDTKIEVANLDKKFQLVKKEKTIAEQKTKIVWLLLSALSIGLSSILFFIYRKRKEAQAETLRQQKFTDELLQNTEDERKRIATDLHDGVNHELLTLKNQANNGKQIESAAIEKVIEEVRQVSRDLYPAMFDNIGLAASIESLCERITEAGLFTTCEINYTIKLSKRNELQLYRIIQEALNNTLKHAKAAAAKVTIDTVGNELQVEIKDNGIGFNTTEQINNANSFGMQSLLQRTRAMGGKSTIESNEQGTKLILKTPIH